MQLEQRSITLTVWVHGAHHNDDEVEEERGPTHQERPEQDSESQGPSHVPAPPTVMTTPAAAGDGESGDLPGVDASQHEHVDVEEADDRQGDEEEDDEADHDEVEVEEPHHEHGHHPACRPDDPQDNPSAPHCHDVVVSECMEYGDVTGRENKSLDHLLK